MVRGPLKAAIAENPPAGTVYHLRGRFEPALIMHQHRHFRGLKELRNVMGGALLLASCDGGRSLPSLKPLVGGLDESQVPPSARQALTHAREDFQRVRGGLAPLYARPAGLIPGTRSRVYEGEGYRLTYVESDYSNVHLHGPEIVLGPSITHGQPYSYDEIERSNDKPDN